MISTSAWNLTWPNWPTLGPYERGALLSLAYNRRVERAHWSALARELVRANAAVQQARKVATHTNDSDIRLCYCEAWLASLVNIARSLP